MEWKKMFAKQFMFKSIKDNEYHWVWESETLALEIYEFIESLLSHQRQELKEKVEQLPQYESNKGLWMYSVSDIIKLLEEEI